MIYRIDELSENSVNPITHRVYDSTWIILMLTDSQNYQKMCGSRNGCAYTIKISAATCEEWKMAVCDCMGFCAANHQNLILVMTEADLSAAKSHYIGHSYNEPFLREGEPAVLVHSTPASCWEQIKREGTLKSWNLLKAEKTITEEHPIGTQLGDPADFSGYIMFGSGVTGEIVVSSKQHGKIVMDVNADYTTGARLYFDAERIARDGLLIRDGCHLKVKDTLPLAPYLIWAATWDTVGLTGPVSVPRIFAEQSDKQFQVVLRQYKQRADGENI